MKAMRSCLPLRSLNSGRSFNSTSKEIIVPFEITLLDDPTLKFTVPKLGEKKKLLDLSQKNVLFFKKEKIRSIRKTKPRSTHRPDPDTNDEGPADEPAAKTY